MNKNDGIIALYKDMKLQAKDWNNDFIHILDGQIVNDKGDSFDWVGSDCEEWHEYLPSTPDKTMTKEKAIIALYTDNLKIKASNWTNKFIYVDSNGIIDNKGNSFDFHGYKDNKWSEWIEPTKEDNTNNINGLETKIDKLMLLVENLTSNKEVVKNKKVTNITNDKILAVYGVNNPADVKTIFSKSLTDAKSEFEVQKAIMQVIPYCWIDKTLTTTSKYYGELRNIIKDVGGDFEKLGLSLLIPPSRTVTRKENGSEVEATVGLYESLNKHYTDKTIANIENKDTYDLDVIKKAKTNLRNMIDNNDFKKERQTSDDRAKAYVYASYLAIVTPRRQIEILFTSKLVKENDTWYFTGLAKKGKEDTKIIAYSLDKDFELLQKMLEYVQSHILKELEGKKVTKTTVASKFNGSFNNSLKSFTDTNYTYKDMREINADMLWIENCKDKDKNECGQIKEEAFKSMVLGHATPKGSLRATLHYMTKKA